MSAQTGIEWADSTFNPWKVCTPASPEGCKNCYAAALSRRFGWGEYKAGVPRIRTSPANWKLPERWNREQFYQCSACGWRGLASGPKARCCQCSADGVLVPSRRRVFCASLADWLDNEVPIEWLVDLLDLIRRTPNLDWLLLTKRIGNWRGRIDAAIECLDDADPSDCIVDRDALRAWLVAWRDGNPPANVWLGATAVNQPELDRDGRKLLAVPARVRFLSIEPMLGAIDLNYTRMRIQANRSQLARAINGEVWIDWVIAGGESGPMARPMHPDWVRSLRNQCEAAGVPFLFKQWGEWLPMGQTMADGSVSCVDKHERPGHWVDKWLMARVGKKAAGRQLDGRTHDGFPAVQP